MKNSCAVPFFAGAALLATAALQPAAAADRPDLADAPVVWWEADREDVPEVPRARNPGLHGDLFHETVVRPFRRHFAPSELIKATGSAFGAQRWPDAQNVNSLDEVPNSTWFTNRIGFYPMTPAECARGFGSGSGPDLSGELTVVGAKTEGVTPGFTVKDPRGDRYLIKFDPPGCIGATTGAGAISARILHAGGYNVPEDVAITFRKEQLHLGDDVQISEEGVERAMTAADLDAILARIEALPDGRYVAIASKFLAGKPVGPFDYKGRRKDDPNDHVDHAHRRELRGLRVFAAWLTHFDTKQGNSLDMWVEDGGRHYVKHHLIDFASTLGTGANGIKERNGWEYAANGPRIMGRLLTLGFMEDDWRRIHRPEGLSEVGYFGVEHWDPMKFQPQVPNTAFTMMTDRDAYWAAKIISAFTDEQLRAICEEAKYRDPRATEYVAEVLAQRRDIIARTFFEKVCPIDFFRTEGGKLVATDLGTARGVWPAASSRYRFRTFAVDADREPEGDEPAWSDAPALSLPIPDDPSSHPFHAFEFQVSRDDKSWTPSVVAYVARSSGRVVAVDR